MQIDLGCIRDFLQLLDKTVPAGLLTVFIGVSYDIAKDIDIRLFAKLLDIKIGFRHIIPPSVCLPWLHPLQRFPR